MIDLGLDTETELVTDAVPLPRLVCVSLYSQGSGDLIHWTKAADVAPVLEDSGIRIIGHGIAYDMAILMTHDPGFIPLIFNAYRSNRIIDTGIRQKLTDIAGGVYRGFDNQDDESVKITYTLEDLSERLINRKLDKNTWRLRYGELRPYPLEVWPEGARIYPVEDARAAHDCLQVQERNAHVLENQYHQTRYEFWLKLMTAWGIRTDEKGIRELTKRTQQDYDLIAADLRAAGLLKADTRKRDGSTKPGSRTMAAVQARVAKAYADMGRQCPLTKGGKTGTGPKMPKSDRDTCEKSEDRILVKYAEFGKLKHSLTTDIPLLRLGQYNPIHAYFETLVETGRTASKPNLQNQKRKGGFRECFVPSPGYVFAVADFGGLELCTLAQCCYSLLGYSALGDALNADMDPHLIIAEILLGIPYATLKQIKKAGKQVDCRGGEKCVCPYCVMSDARQTGKVANFGFPGGLGPKALVYFAWQNYRVELTLEQATQLKAIWLSKWPEMKHYLDLVGRIVRRNDPTITQLFANRIRGGVSFTEACNTLFQGLGSDIAKEAGWLICQACYLETDSDLFGCRIANFVHDEFITEAPEARAHEAAIEQSRLMKLAAAPYLPNVKIEAEPMTMRRWSKDAKAIYENGRLVPWDLAA